MNDHSPNFSIKQVDQFGDPTEGESQLVRLTHICQALAGGVVELQTNFSSFLGSEQTLTCPNCSGSVRVLKSSGSIFISK